MDPGPYVESIISGFYVIFVMFLTNPAEENIEINFSVGPAEDLNKSGQEDQEMVCSGRSAMVL
jgi:hypothetical protein